jgi:hypothetical protein
MAKVLLKVNNKVMATDGKLLTSEKQEGTMLKTLLDATKSTGYLFNGYKGESVEGLISYSDTENVESFRNMFYYCTNLEVIPQLNTNNGKNFANAFNTCKKLKKIDMSRFYCTSTEYSAGICFACNSLKAFIIRSFGDQYILASGAFQACYRMLHEANATYNPNNTEDGYVYVPRDMIETLSSATNWSTLQFRALEDYTDDGTTTGKFLDEKAGL